MSLEPMPEGSDPINHVRWVRCSELSSNNYNPNRVHKPEFRLLEHSLLSTGWVQPVLVAPDGEIIDGFHRWRLAQDSPKIRDRWGNRVPVVVLDVTRDEAMAMTIRMNRAKGTHVAVNMSAIVHELVNDYDWTPERVSKEIGAGMDEVNLLLCDDVFTVKKIADWAYSPAWYPIEEKAK